VGWGGGGEEGSGRGRGGEIRKRLHEKWLKREGLSRSVRKLKRREGYGTIP